MCHKHQDLLELEFVDRGRKTKFQAGEKVNYLICRFNDSHYVEPVFYFIIGSTLNEH